MLKMNNTTKEKIGCDVICRNHSARTERDLYRVCPSKLSKRELEDLYFALLETNLELKKTVNIQQDKIKVLSTKVQRMTVLQKNGVGKEKDCCASKAVVNEQKESITNLKKANEHMAERIRLLNMRLCSAKQFLKRSPSQANNSKCMRCSFKNSSLSALNAKRTDTNMRTSAVSCQFLDKDDASARTTRTVETETEKPDKQDPDQPCNENKCRTIMDELKEKIVNLQEELSKSHADYSERITKLECQVSRLYDENVRVKTDRAASEHALQQRTQRAEELAVCSRRAEAKCNELKMELAIEKRRVQELETGLKLANMSSNVVQTIQRLTAENEDKQEPVVRRDESLCSRCSQTDKSPNKTLLDTPVQKTDEVTFAKSDDSGYTELNKSSEADEESVMVKINQGLLKKIAELQTQLDMLRISAAGETVSGKRDEIPNEFECHDVETKDFDENQFLNEQDSASLLAEPLAKRTNTSIQKIPVENTNQKDVEKTQGYEEAGSSKPWEDYLITGRGDNMPEDRDHVNFDQTSLSSATIRDSNRTNTKTVEDDHNRFQIPGPIPVNTSGSKDKRKTFKTPTNSKGASGTRKKGATEEKTVKIYENNKDSYFQSDKWVDVPESNTSPDSNLANDGVNSDRKEGNEKNATNVIITDADGKVSDKPLETEASLSDRTFVRDSIYVNRKKLASKSQDGTGLLLEKDSSTSVFIKCDNGVQADAKLEKQQATQIAENLDEFDYCESRATICRCPVLEKRHVAVFRSCSGTLRFRTSDPTKLRRCGCQVQTHSLGAETVPPPGRQRHDSGTYTVRAEQRERATSPDNTEREISSLSDLPSEKDVKSVRQRRVSVMSPALSPELSPGEERATSTYTDTHTNTDTHTDYGSLSEGELPLGGKVRRLSTGERHSDTIYSPHATTPEKMDATLQCIGAELARCRRLLDRRPQVRTRTRTRIN